MTEQKKVQLYVKKGARYKKFEEAGINEFLVTRDAMSPGLWLIANRHLGRSYQLVHKVCEIPSAPERFAGVMVNVDELAQCIGTFKNEFGKSLSKDSISFTPSNQDMAKFLLDFVLKKGGTEFGKYKKPDSSLKGLMEINRNLGFDL